jgi:hypothetical protein
MLYNQSMKALYYTTIIIAGIWLTVTDPLLGFAIIALAVLTPVLGL